MPASSLAKDPDYFPQLQFFHFTTQFMISVLEISESGQVKHLNSTFLKIKVYANMYFEGRGIAVSLTFYRFL